MHDPTRYGLSVEQSGTSLFLTTQLYRTLSAQGNPALSSLTSIPEGDGAAAGSAAALSLAACGHRGWRATHLAPRKPIR